MRYSMSFGKLPVAPRRRQGAGQVFGLAVLGDFSGRANRGELETGSALAARKPRRVDVDNLDDVLESFRLTLRLPIGDEGAAVEVRIASLDDFHPDQLYENVEFFSELAGLRKRLQNASTCATAAAEVRSWGDASAATSPPMRPRPRGESIPNAKLNDFARLMGAATAAASPTPVDELIKQIVRPHVQAAASPDQAQLLAAVDAALTAALRRLLHHPDFQMLEALWRSVDLLVRQVETDEQLQIVLYDVTAEEIAADLCAVERLDATGLYQLLVEQPALDLRTTPPSAIVGNYAFEQTPPHADLLGRIAKIAAAAQAPFIAAIGIDALEKKKPEDIHPLVAQSWAALRSLPHAAYLGLTTPRFMLRWPYGAKTEPIDPFPFEEFTPRFGLKGFLWGNTANLVGLLLAKTFAAQGMDGMELGSIMIQGDLPLYYFTDSDGDQIALPCTERLASESLSAHVITQGFMPLLWMRGRPEVRLGSFNAVGGTPLAGPWRPFAVPVDVVEEPPAAELSASPPLADEPAIPVEPIARQAPMASAPPASEPPPSRAASAPPAEPDPDEGDEPDAGDELDDLLNALESEQTPAPSQATSMPVAPASASAADVLDDDDEDLSALLSSIEGTGSTDNLETDDGDMDPDLAALLAEL